ncbi:L-threonine aldolase [Maritalea myrionectae]|uniref:L-threonine aldolase n=1 Tax=Maritalea myrionectae TaxID=454601 RepID=A0A2R4MA41_9HYPH|nr:beta-eliminating lyase-related protein [Maritalea myrionectae]AVX02882.1 L-threonine aldolase [Maritalea myrionectae]
MVAREKMLACTHVLHAFAPFKPADLFAKLAQSDYAQLPSDVYGAGGASDLVVERLKELFGTSGARFCIKGMIAQMAALRAAVERQGNNLVAIHRMTHFDIDEMEAVEILHPIQFRRLGTAYQPFTVDDLDKMGEVPGVVSVELPVRRAGYKLTPLEELVKISNWCRERGVHFHLDGARVFGVAEAYGKSLKEIMALCDSLYCSFYKELANIGGCGLLADEEFLAESDVWFTRHGANVPFEFPQAITALIGLDEFLPRIGEFTAFAKALAAAFNKIDGVRTVPLVPETPNFQVHIEAPKAALEAAFEKQIEADKVWLSGHALPTIYDEVQAIEVAIGAGSMSLSVEEWANYLSQSVGTARNEIEV